MPSDIDYLEAQFSEMTDVEINAFQQFERKYKVQYPYPEKERPALGWEFNASLTVAISAIILAAFRTGDAFYKAAFVQNNSIFASAEAIAAVIAIEGAVVLNAVRRAKDRSQTNSAISEAGLWLALIISILAGLFQSINLVENVANSMFANILQWTLIVFMGLGATIIAALAGTDLGVRLVLLEKALGEANEHFTNSVRSYRARMMKQWKNSNELFAVDENKQTNYKRTQTNEQSLQDDYKQTNEPSVRKQTSKRTNKRAGNTRKEIINKLLDTVFAEENRVAGVTELANILARADVPNPDEHLDQVDDLTQRYKGNVSNIRKSWLREKGLLN